MKNISSFPRLSVKDGRLINDRFDGETGIAHAARIRKMEHRARKANVIAEGIELAEARKSLYNI